MKITIQMVVETDEALPPASVELLTLHRETLHLETLGLSLEESRQVLFSLQQQLTEHQAEAFTQQAQLCPHCQQRRARKGRHQITMQTLFGKVVLNSPRFYACPCESDQPGSFSPLAHCLPERTTPECLYLQTKWAALLPYGVTTQLLEEVLPLQVSPTSLKRHLYQMAERCEQALGEEQFSFIEGCPRDWKTLPDPEAPITIGLDGGYIHVRDKTHRKAGSVEVIVGKSIPGEQPAKRFGFVQGYDTKPRRRLFETLKTQGFQRNQTLCFLSDGGATVRDLQFYLSPQSEHLLDWFHITMRLTVMQQSILGLPDSLPDNHSRLQMSDELERIKWFLWHGNVFQALRTVDDLSETIEMLHTMTRLPNLAKLSKSLPEFRTYIAANRAFIPNYGDRYRYGEIISTAFVESTVNQVISKRFVKKQQMRWTKRGAHLLLQVRVQVLNDDWQTTFLNWYPHMSSHGQASLPHQAVA